MKNVTIEGTSEEKVLSKEERLTLLKSSAATVNALVGQLEIAIKSHVQSTEQLEAKIHETAVAALRHAHDHGDVMPCDRIVKSLSVHPTTRTLMAELISWFRANSPIWWDSKGNPHQAKDGEPNFKPYDEEAAEKEAFFQRPAAVRARKAADEAHAQALKPYTFQNFLARVGGLRKTYENAKKEDAEGRVRGIARGDDKKIRGLIKAVETAVATVEPTEEAEKAA